MGRWVDIYKYLLISLSSNFFNLLFIFEKERDRTRAGNGQRAGETQNPKQTLADSVSPELNAGLEPMNGEITT